MNWGDVLRQNAASYAAVAIGNIGREYPNGFNCHMREADDLPRRPKDITPVFYGSYDWHSCVEMHWVLVRLLRTVADSAPAAEIVAALDRQLTPSGLQAEAATLSGPFSRAVRPYGWSWALTLAADVSQLARDESADPVYRAAASRWSAALVPLAQAVTKRFLDWLPKATYPVRYGIHQNSAFGLGRALAYARDRAEAGDSRLADAIADAADRWFSADRDCPAGWEPSGSDFLSPALVEAELMALLKPADEFAGWLAGFLPGIAAGSPAAIFTPAVVSDSADGQIAHLHGLNASRAWCWRRIAESLPPGDPRIEPATRAARTHADAALPHVVGDDYMVEHWLAAYAVLLMT
ncbi:MAG TPA: DUF2891 domain-containing protein [Streptosporangiaceae bacterium]|nr:DUF2891 domain-containing protein [Streptosporangiaceae bacterium]